MDQIKEQVMQLLRTLWQNKYRIFFCGLALCTLFGALNYFKSADYASANISFNYSEASLGLSPNKTRFNAYEIVSDEVMQRAIERVGLQGSITPSELAGTISLNPDGTGNLNGDDDYISTSYNISINSSTLELRSRKTIDLIKSVCESYRELFLANYCDNQSIAKEKLEITTDCEPFLRLNEIELRAERLSRYLDSRLDENKSYVDDANLDSSTNNFTTLGKKLNNIVDYDLPNALAYVIEGGIAREPAMLSSILEYKNKIDDISASKDMAFYDANKNGISVYEKSMTSVVMIPTTDELSEYYMSRTKTAMDTMARAADTYLADATEIRAEIVDTSYVIQKIQENATSQQRLTEAQAMVNKLEQAINDITDELFVLDKAFIKYKSQNYISFTYYNASFLQRVNLKRTVMEAAALELCGMAWLALRKRRKGKKRR